VDATGRSRRAPTRDRRPRGAGATPVSGPGAGAVDAPRPTVVPVLLGEGTALFGTAGRRRGLAPVEATTHDGGVVEPHCEPAG
jgi:hypothetical protein